MDVRAEFADLAGPLPGGVPVEVVGDADLLTLVAGVLLEGAFYVPAEIAGLRSVRVLVEVAKDADLLTWVAGVLHEGALLAEVLGPRVVGVLFARILGLLHCGSSPCGLSNLRLLF